MTGSSGSRAREGTLEKWLKLLEGGSLQDRLRAAWALGEILRGREESPAVQPLIAALKDEDTRVRRVAAEALMKIGMPAFEPLVTALKNEDPYVRVGAAYALGEMKDARAVEPLVAALNDDEASVRWEAAQALLKAKDERADVPLADALVRFLKGGAANMRSEAAAALGEVKSARAVEALITALEDEDFKVRFEAVRALGKMKDARAVEFLIVALKDHNPAVRRVAVRALVDILGEIKGSPAAEPLTAALSDENPDVRNEAALALFGWGESDWRTCTDPEMLLALAEDLGVTVSDSELRLFAIECCRRVEHLLIEEEFQQALEVAERYADGRATKEELLVAAAAAKAAIDRVKDYDVDRLRDALKYTELGNVFLIEDDRSGVNTALVAAARAAVAAASDRNHDAAYYAARAVADKICCRRSYRCDSPGGFDFDAEWEKAYKEERAYQCDILRDMLDDPFPR